MDPVRQELGADIIERWPNDRRRMSDRLLPYFSYCDDVTMVAYFAENDFIMESTKEKVHEDHMYINSSLRMLQDPIYWPQMSTNTRHYVETCGGCAPYADKPPAESMVMTETPNPPWKKVG